ERACCEARGGGGLGALRRSKREGRRSGLHMVLPSVIALPPSIDVPRTIPIGLTNAALNSPTRTAWPSTAAVVAVTRVMSVVIVAVVVGLRVVRALRGEVRRAGAHDGLSAQPLDYAPDGAGLVAFSGVRRQDGRSQGVRRVCQPSHS